MAKDVERLVLELSADVSRLERGLKNGQAITQRQTRAIERQFDQMNKRTVGSVTAMSSGINNAIGGIALGLAAREVQQYADAWTRATNALRAAGSSNEEAGQQLDMLVSIALRSRTSLESTVTLYNRLTAASNELGVSQERIARVVETANKALATSNLSSSERASALTQLAQGLGSGNLQGDELRAIRENSVVLAQAIADEFDTTIGGLKELGAEGELTSARVFRALEKASLDVDASFARTRATISDAFTNLQTKATQFVGKLDASTGASAKLAATIEFVANHLDEIATAAQVAGVAVGTYYAGAMTAAAVRTAAATVSAVAYQLALVRMAAAQKGATSAQILLNAALTANPIGLAITAVAALAAGLVFLESRYGRAEVAARELNEVQAQASGFLDRYKQAQFEAANATDANRDAALRHVEALKAEAREIINVARLNAQRRINEAVAARGEADRLIGAANDRRSGQNSRSFSNASIIQDQASSQAARTAIQQAGEARDAANEAIAAWNDLEKAVNSPLPSTAVNPPAGGTGGAGGGSRRSGPTPEELAAMRTEIALEGQLDLARARGDEVEERRIQRELDIAALTERYKRAEIANAKDLATIQVDALAAEEQASRDFERSQERSARNRELNAELTAKLAAEEEARLEFRLRMAELDGDTRLIVRLERELELLRQINALGPNADPRKVQQIRDRQGALNEAEDQAIARDRGREAARTFIDIVRADDIGTELGNRFRQAAWENLEDVLAKVASAIFSQQGGGGNWFTQAAGAIFGGNRALGGPVRAGRAYRVNENTPNSEFFVPKQDGWVGNIKQPTAQRGGSSVSIRQGDITIVGQGDAALRAYIDRAIAVSQRQTIAVVKAGAPAERLETQLLKD